MITPEEKAVKIIKKSLPAVVSISAVPKGQKDKEDGFVKKLLAGNKNKESGGAGFIVDKKGTVVTTMHVVSTDPGLNYLVTTSDGKTYDAKKIGVNFLNDTAFLRIETGKDLTPLPLGNSSRLELGQEVIAIGNVLGLFQNTVSQGIISGLSRSISASNEKLEEDLHGLIQTDAAINPGNSGGPLINSRGEVVGINSASVAYAENIGFAIPINSIKKDLERITQYGFIKRPFLGVRYVLINEKTRELFKLSARQGALVISPDPSRKAIIKNSPAEKGGIKEGDIILEINDSPVTPKTRIEKMLENAIPGQSIKLRISRKGKIEIFRINLEEY